MSGVGKLSQIEPDFSCSLQMLGVANDDR